MACACEPGLGCRPSGARQAVYCRAVGIGWSGAAVVAMGVLRSCNANDTMSLLSLDLAAAPAGDPARRRCVLQ